jgi:thioredoxin 1
MSTVALTEDTFEDTVIRPGITLVDWWASWCGPCRMFAPIFERVSEQHPDAIFAKVDTEAQQALAASFGITSIPTLMIIRDKIILYAQPGAIPEPALEDLIAKAREVDMDEVRASIAGEKAGTG